jgi:UDP-2,3-diacylglucosamine hydrolase
MQLPPGQKIYFLSDFHLGAPNYEASRKREDKLVRFLEHCRKDAAAIFLVGDIFDFWYEYLNVVPKGYVRLFGKLAELSDAGIALHLFVGNHDMWMKTYFQKEMNIPVYFNEQEFEFNGRRFFIAHGDGLGPGDKSYKLLKNVFRNPVCQWLFGMLPPVIGIGLANFFSRKSRESVAETEKKFLGEDKEALMIYSREVLQRKHFDYFVFGHRHVPGVYALSANSTYVNLGDWVIHFTYGEFDGANFELKKWVE